MITYDVTNLDSFTNVREWVREVQRYAREDANKLLVGNKNDLVDRRVVEFDQGQALANKLGMPFLETSAKTAENVEKAFFTMALEIQTRMDARRKLVANKSDDATGPTIHGDSLSDEPAESKSSCC